jgi:hypothetical protein
VVFVQSALGLGNESGLATFELINVNSSAGDFVELTSNCFATLVRFPGSTVGFSHNAAHAFGWFGLASTSTELDVALRIQVEELFKGTVPKAIVPVKQFQLAGGKQGSAWFHWTCGLAEMHVSACITVLG